MFSGYDMVTSITGPEYYLNHKNKTIKRNKLECMYYGCETINFYSTNGITDWDIYYHFPKCNTFITNDGLRYCSNLTTCVIFWQFWCGDDGGHGTFEPFVHNSLACFNYDTTDICCNNESIAKISKKMHNQYDKQCKDNLTLFYFEVAGFIVLLICIAVLFYCCCCRRRNKYKSTPMVVPAAVANYSQIPERECNDGEGITTVGK